MQEVSNYLVSHLRYYSYNFTIKNMTQNKIFCIHCYK